MVLDDPFLERSKRAAMRTTDRDRTACAYGTALPPDRPHPYSYQKLTLRQSTSWPVAWSHSTPSFLYALNSPAIASRSG